MRITQGTFSYLPDLTDAEIAAQLAYCVENEWAISVEYTDDPHPRNVYWEMWGLPMFDLAAPGAAMDQVQACRAARPGDYIRVNAYDRRHGRQTTALSFIVNRPPIEPGFQLERTEGADRQVHYTLRSYTMAQPPGARRGMAE